MDIDLNDDELNEIKGYLMRLEREDIILTRYPKLDRLTLQMIRTDMSPATPATKRKLKNDPLLVLFSNGRITAHNLDSAEEIRRAWMVENGELLIRCSGFDMRVDKLGHTPIVERDGEIQAVKRYRSWVKRCDTAAVHVRSILETLIFPLSLTQVDRRNNFRNGKTAEYIAAGLNLYQEIHRHKKKRLTIGDYKR